jgi:hypothetical protein
LVPSGKTVVGRKGEHLKAQWKPQLTTQCLQRVRNWFKNHTCPSVLQHHRKRLFTFKQHESRKLSNVQQFSKLYYVCHYRKPVTKTWQDFYLTHYKRVKEDLADANVTKCDKVIQDSIREDLRAGVLDTIPTEFLGAEEDMEITGNNEDEDEGGIDDEPPGESPGINVPNVAVWFWNAMMRMFYAKASPSQQDAVEEHKMKEEDDETDDSDDEVGDGDKHIKRLQRLLRFVFMDMLSVLELTSSTISSHRSAMQYTVIYLLDQIFKETGFVGSVCLAGPDPQKGGKMMMVSCVYRHSCFITMQFTFISRIHKMFADGSDFTEMYPRVKPAAGLRTHSTV